MGHPPEFAKRADVYLLTGFLGAGKTTLLRNMLRWETDLSGTVVLVNELGKVGIDGDILRKSGSDVVELTSGCVCCTLKGELIETLQDIAGRFNPRRIIIEATGVAQPESMTATLETPEIKTRMNLKRLITVLDIKLWLARDVLGDFFWRQLQQSKLILLNKIDRVEPPVVSQVLADLRAGFPDARIIPAQYCQVDPDLLWADRPDEKPATELKRYYAQAVESNAAGPRGSDRSPGLSTLPMEGSTGGPPFIAFDFQEEKPLSEPCFKKFLQQAPAGLFRIKGPVRFPDRTVLINYAGGSGDWEEWEDEGSTRLAFVGWMVEPAVVLRELKTCVQA